MKKLYGLFFAAAIATTMVLGDTVAEREGRKNEIVAWLSV